MLQAMDDVFRRHPDTARVLYLVDEEFIGAGPGAVARALMLASTLHEAGFAWETSCRVDQVARPDAGRDWHLDRARMWRALAGRGLRRCLFGVESGVTSILERFAKDTVAQQNVLAARSLSALGVATRFTYITFDPLMTLDELRASHAFQARTDLLLHPLPQLDVAAVVDGVHDTGFVTTHATGRPFYTQIPYMLVSMECLTGAAYTRRVQQAGLAGALEPAMGRIQARYRDWRIGVASRQGQLWIDRNFTLDYTLKSLEKTLDGPPRHAVRAARTVLKQAAFDVLGDMLTRIGTYPLDTPREPDLTSDLQAAMDERHARLRTEIAGPVMRLVPALPPGPARTLHAGHDRWQAKTSWRLINAASCTT
jgi:hypothetical protein